ncbi:MAG: hypothetical protein B7X04_03250 [Parcubacteria group bacterium 21-54-25]|nr:MAG: hypothetical protein B7X04_03250 [Parcubacteria group bacterium 21-54-25]HQU08005.1 hypothetical protein [Candidatus Paceibacterota bacterium]
MKNEKYKADIKKLVDKGHVLYYRMIIDYLDEEELAQSGLDKAAITNTKKAVGHFSEEYQTWYSEALEVLRQILPSRVDDFVAYYRPEKTRKKNDINYENYTIQDCLNGLNLTHSYSGEKVVGADAAIPKFRQQVKIIETLQKTFDGSLFDIRALLQADLFDDELDASDELKKKGFLRAAGALAGVVLESHLREVCSTHSISIKKKRPTIADYNDALKNANVIDVPVWRNVQFLADIRNICDHKTGREPKEQEVEDLVTGVRKVSKTLF